MQFQEVMHQLEQYGNETTKRIYMNHGAKEPMFGVKVADLKKIVKKVKKNHELSLQLFDTGNSDAMYLAGLIADENQITKNDLQQWAEQAHWYMISEFTVAAVAAESRYGLELARQWIKSDRENIASAGWATYSGLLAIKPNEELDVSEIDSLLDFIKANIHQAQNRVRYAMNNFVISVGTYLPHLTDRSIAIAKSIGKVSVDMGGTACKVPFAPEYIEKVKARGSIGKKRNQVRC
ncbi:DNA alkylation repair protein [candidate division KSB1 bacterium]|nr:DNA alkylation repair protein [candidate division KSB1 bacterium]